MKCCVRFHLFNRSVHFLILDVLVFDLFLFCLYTCNKTADRAQIYHFEEKLLQNIIVAVHSFKFVSKDFQNLECITRV